MLNKNLRTLSKFLGKEKVSVIAGVGFGIIIAINPYRCNAGNLSGNTVTAQADAKVLADNDVRNSLSNTTMPSVDELSMVESEHMTVKVKEDIIVSQGYDTLLDEALSAEKEYKEYIKEQKRLAREAEKEKKKKKKLASKSKKRTALFEITAYCHCQKCCGKYSPEVTGRVSKTASGTVPCAGRTVAVDPNVIPLGSTVVINGHKYIAEDTGSAVKGNIIDMYMDSHSDALKWGRRKIKVTYYVK